MPLVKISDLPELTLADGIVARVVHTGNVSQAHVTLQAGAVLPEHAHHHEQVVNVIEGELELVVEGQAYRLVPDVAMVLEPNVPHSGRAITACRVLDIFHPVREDFRQMAEGRKASHPYDKE